MGGFNEHVYKLCLDYRLYSAAIQLQANLGLGKAFSAMLPYVEGLHVMGYLDEESYELYKNKYSVTLEDAHNQRNKSPVDIQREQTRAAYCKTANREFGQVLDQWSTMKESSKVYWVKKARLKDNARVQNAKLVLELAEHEKGALAFEG